MRELTGGPVPGVTLSPAQLAIVVDGLCDGSEYRMRCAAESCDDRVADVEKAQAYSDLAAELEGGAE